MTNKFYRNSLFLLIITGTFYSFLKIICVVIIDSLIFIDPFEGDGSAYYIIGWNLAHNRGYLHFFQCPDIIWPPVYPFFINIILRIFNYNSSAIIYIQIFLQIVCGLLIYVLAYKITKNQYTALLAGSLYILWPLNTIWALRFYTETLFMFELYILLLVLLKAFETKNFWYFLLAGILTGLCTLTRASFELFGIFLVFCVYILKYFIPQFKGYRKSLSIYLISTILTILPWTVRNYIVVKRFIPVAAAGGMTLCAGTNWNAKGFWDTNNEEYMKARRKAFNIATKQGHKYPLRRYDIDQGYYQVALENIKRWPLQNILLVFIKFWRLYFVSLRHSYLPIRIIMITALLIVYISALSRIKKYLSEGKYEIWIILFPVIYLTLIHSLVYSIARYMDPIRSIFFIFFSDWVCSKETICCKKTLLSKLLQKQ